MGRPKGSMNKKTLEKLGLSPAAAKAQAKFKAQKAVKEAAKTKAATPKAIKAAKASSLVVGVGGENPKGLLNAALNTVLDLLDAGTAMMSVDELEGTNQVGLAIQGAVAGAAIQQTETMARLQKLSAGFTPPAAPLIADVVTEVPASAVTLSSSSVKNGKTAAAPVETAETAAD